MSGFFKSLLRKSSSTFEASPRISDDQLATMSFRPSYISRHWRGELPLDTSCYNSLLITAATVPAQAALFFADNFQIQAPRLIAAAQAGLPLFLVAAYLWLLVGIWRSAGRTIEERRTQDKHVVWAGLARVVAGLSFLFLIGNSLLSTIPYVLKNLQIAIGGNHHILKVLNGGSKIKSAGEIDVGTGADLRTLLDATPAVRTIDLDSLRGTIAEANQVRDLIHEYHLATFTAANCFSACRYPSYLGPGGKLGFQRYTFPGITQSKMPLSTVWGERTNKRRRQS